MSSEGLKALRSLSDVAPSRLRLATWIESGAVQRFVIATFTIPNLFIGIIVSTMQELSVLPDQEEANRETHEILERIERDLATLRRQMKK